jgi:hypothetical protein
MHLREGEEMILKNKYYEFRFGIMITSVSLEICVGWLGFMWLWSRVDPLEGLPMMEMGPCNKCGAADWNGAQPDPNGGFTDCNKCTQSTSAGPR